MQAPFAKYMPPVRQIPGIGRSRFISLAVERDGYQPEALARAPSTGKSISTNLVAFRSAKVPHSRLSLRESSVAFAARKATVLLPPILSLSLASASR